MEKRNHFFDLSIGTFSDNFPQSLHKDVLKIKNLLNNGQNILIVKSPAQINPTQIIKLQNFIASSLGEILPQNSEGEKNVLVYNRDSHRTVLNGARFHQTSEGGFFHTDNANTPHPWDFVILSCLSTAETGGESILVNGVKVYEELKNQFPDILVELEKNFFWEERGISNNIFPAPILSYHSDGKPHFRYLRPYMEAAHLKARHPLTTAQIQALEILETLFKKPDFQFRYKLEVGDILITRDSLVPHTRTFFEDNKDALPFHEWKQNMPEPLKRTLNRIWVKSLN